MLYVLYVLVVFEADTLSKRCYKYQLVVLNIQLLRLFDRTVVQTKAQYTPPTPTRRNCRVSSRWRRRCVHKFATSSRRLPTDSIDNLETGQTDCVCVCFCVLTTWILIDTDNFFQQWRHNDVIVPKVINIYQNWYNQTLWSLFGQFQNCRQNSSAVVVS